jgi:hypothetical protein
VRFCCGFVTTSQKWKEKISEAMLCNHILCQAGKGAVDIYEGFRENLVMILWHKDFVSCREMVEDGL